MNYIDIHSHILPHLDDGAASMQESLEMLRVAASEGITDIIATPHYTPGRFRTDREKLLAVVQELRKEAEDAGIHVRIYPGTEVYYRSELEERFASGLLSTMNGTEYVLVEFSPMESFLHIRNAMDDLFGMGLHPILAHAERYQCLLQKVEQVRDLKNMGCEIQVNADSVSGGNGFFAKRFVHRLLKEQLVDYIGTDAHSTGKRGPRIQKCAEILCKKYGKAYASAILHDNAKARLLGGEKDAE